MILILFIRNISKISFILTVKKNITDLSYMFYGCEELLLIRDISNINYDNKKLILYNIENEINLSKENEIFNQDEEKNLFEDF